MPNADRRRKIREIVAAMVDDMSQEDSYVSAVAQTLSEPDGGGGDESDPGVAIVHVIAEVAAELLNVAYSMSVPETSSAAAGVDRALFDRWIAFGEAAGWCTEPYCAIHDNEPYTADDIAMLDAGMDPCLVAVRLLIPD